MEWDIFAQFDLGLEAKLDLFIDEWSLIWTPLSDTILDGEEPKGEYSWCWGEETMTWYKDSDGDGYSDGTTVEAEERPNIEYYLASELVSISEFDSNDYNATSYPGADEICNDMIDNDQDGDADCSDSECVCQTWYRDSDNDGYGDPDDSIISFSQQVGYVGNNNDCNDSAPEINPEANEICGDNIDQDCQNGDLACEYPSKVVKILPVSGPQHSIAVHPNEQVLYVGTNGDNFGINVIQTSDHTVLTNYDISYSSYYTNDLAIAADGNLLMALHTYEVAMLNSIDGSLSDIIELTPTDEDLDPHSHFLLTPDSKYLYVFETHTSSVPDDQTVKVIDTSTYNVVDTIDIGNAIWRKSTITPDGKYIYVINPNGTRGPRIFVIQTSDNSVLTEIPYDGYVNDITSSINDNHVYVAASNDILVIDTLTNTIVDTINFGTQTVLTLTSLATGEYLYAIVGVSQNNNWNVYIVDTSTFETVNTFSLADESSPRRIASSVNGEFIYVTDGNFNQFIVIGK